ncbi:tetratricopeptide repeat protein [Frankia nepalensis]|uniref:tetratricopeptide repeat protein n=1 Tax=Frankia nepalensis TaxID=1836974 RepID=UPI0027DD5776|nr:tetratricopeptide repeat protein [Frankia nepalensis]
MQVRAMAELFPGEASARFVLGQAGFPAGRFPWGAPNAVLFWGSVSGELRAGAVVGGTARLLGAVRELYPGNAVFADGVGAVVSGPGGRLAWNVPGRPVRFVGRERLLERVHGVLSGGGRVALVALDGMGGVGKTSVALEYAHRYADRFDVVWWVPSERVELVDQHLAGLAVPLGLPVGADARVVWSGLGLLGSWLVVFDNVDDPESVRAVRGFVPSAGGRVLVTSRRRSVRALGVPVSVGVLDRTASVELIADRVPGVNRAAAGRLAELMGDLPLGVDATAGYLDETDTPAEEYAALLAEQPGSAVKDVWRSSVDRLRVELPAAVELLELSAWCDPEPIPLDLFTDHPDRLGGTLARVAADRRGWLETVGALVRFSLARRDGDRLIVHRLVGAAVRDAMSAQSVAGVLTTLAGLLRAVLPGEIWGNPAGWPRWEMLLPHVLTVTDRGRDRSVQALDDLCWLADRAATYLQGHGQVAAALRLFERTVADEERVLGVDHPSTLTARNNLAYAYQAVGRVADAIGLDERTVADRERVLGVDHPDTLMSRNNLAYAYRAVGRVVDAIGLFERTVADRERVLGVDHPDTLMSRDNLAGAYRAVGRVVDAIGLFERAVADRERVLGVDHPDTLTTRNNLASAYEAVGRVVDAIGLFESTVADAERVLGVDHPDTLTARNNVAHAYLTVGRVEQAIGLFERTVADAERVLGVDHLHTLMSRDNLASAYRAVGRVADAIGLYERTVADAERVLGVDHPDTLTARNNLAYAYLTVGRVAEAIGLYERTVADRERVLGVDHPSTLTARNNLAYAYLTVGRVEQAIGLFERTVADAERVLGVDHLHTLMSRSNLASAYRAVGRVADANNLHTQVLADLTRVFGVDNTHTRTIGANLAITREQGVCAN